MTNADSTTGAGGNPSQVAVRLAEIDRRLEHLQEQREARRDRAAALAADTVVSQDGITDDHGFGHDTGSSAGQGHRRSGLGY